MNYLKIQGVISLENHKTPQSQLLKPKIPDPILKKKQKRNLTNFIKYTKMNDLVG